MGDLHFEPFLLTSIVVGGGWWVVGGGVGACGGPQDFELGWGWA